jgi:hypothetical protein
MPGTWMELKLQSGFHGVEGIANKNVATGEGGTR